MLSIVDVVKRCMRVFVSSRMIFYSVLAQIHRDSVEPGAELAVSSKRFNRQKRTNKCILGNIFGLGRVTQHTKAEVVHTTFMYTNELLEGGFVPFLEAHDESLFVHRSASFSNPVPSDTKV